MENNQVPTCQKNYCTNSCATQTSGQFYTLCSHHLQKQRECQTRYRKRKKEAVNGPQAKRSRSDGSTDVAVSLPPSIREVIQTDQSKITKIYEFPDGFQYTEIEEKTSTTHIR